MSSPSYAHLARSFFPELVVQHLFLPVSGGTVTFALLGDHVCLQPLGLFFAVEPEHRQERDHDAEGRGAGGLDDLDRPDSSTEVVQLTTERLGELQPLTGLGEAHDHPS